MTVTIAEFFSTGAVADLLLAIILIEAAALWLFRRRTGRGPRLAEVAPFLAAGAFLVLALRSALVGAPWWCVAAALAASGLAHAVDVARRFRV